MLPLAFALASEPPLLTPEQQQADFDQLWEALERSHPSLDLYTPQAELDAVRAAARARLDTPRTELELWTVLAASVTPVGCGHTHVRIPWAGLDRAAEAGALFPFDLVVSGGALHVDPRSGERGRIVEIEGRSGEALLDELRALQSSDGLSEPFQDFVVDAWGELFATALLGPHATWNAVLDRGEGPETVVVPGRSEPGGHRGASPEPDEELSVVLVDPATGARLPPKRSHAAGRVLLLNVGDFPRKGFRRAIVRPFVKAVRGGPIRVVVDLRRNGGGSPWSAYDLFGHFLAEDTVVYGQRIFTRANIEERFGHVPSRLPAGWTPIGDDRIDIGYGDSAVAPALAPRWDGEIVVLVSGNTFSTAADFAAVVKREGLGRIVGTPTGGSATLQTSGGSDEIVLAHSRIEVSIPLSRSELVDPDGRLADGVGVQPDVWMEPSLDDLATGRDPVLESVLGPARP